MINTKNILKTLLFLDKNTQLTSYDEYNGAYSISVEEIRQLCDHIEELELDLEIADDALTAILEKESKHDDLFNINVVFETGEIALEALKQIRGEK
ncbi:MAG: hypothetical protein QG556_366 [Pseudomonadota bacterium]|nr:hypothetical protein [Pseudomonadota bacterium]